MPARVFVLYTMIFVYGVATKLVPTTLTASQAGEGTVEGMAMFVVPG